VKNKLSCDIVMDLLPSYVDGLTRETTNKEVKEHLEDCENCLKSYIIMQTPAKQIAIVEEQKEIDFLRETKRKSKKKVVLTVILTVLICGGVFLGNYYLGNPISYVVVTEAVETYIEENYKNKDYYVEDVTFESGVRYPYCATIKSESSKDIVFYVFLSSNGKVGGDNYEYAIEDKYVVFERISKEYFEWVEAVVAKKDFPVEPIVVQGENVRLCYGRLRTQGRLVGEYGADYGIVMRELELDKEYDIRELGKAAGNIVVNVTSDIVTAEEAAKSLLLIKEYLDKEGVTFYAIDFMLAEPMVEGKEAEYISVTGFLYTDIYEEGLAERIQVAHDAEKTYRKDHK